MPVYLAGVRRRELYVDGDRIAHAYLGGVERFAHPDAPPITSFVVDPTSTVPAAWTSSVVNRLTWVVPPITAGDPGGAYNYGTVVTVAEATDGNSSYRRGYSRTRGGGFGAISVQPSAGTANGAVDFICYFANHAMTAGGDLERRYFVRAIGDVYTNPMVAIIVDGVSYPLTARGASGFTTAQDVPVWAVGETHNVQVQFQDGTYAWPNTLSATRPATPATYPALALAVTTEDGTRTPINIAGLSGEANTTTPTPRQDAHYALTATQGGRQRIARADFTYNVPASIESFVATPVTGGEPAHTQLVNLSGRFYGHQLTRAVVSRPQAPDLDLLSPFTGAARRYRHLNQTLDPAWRWDIITDQGTRRSVAREGAMRDVVFTLTVQARDGSQAVATDSVPIPA